MWLASRRTAFAPRHDFRLSWVFIIKTPADPAARQLRRFALYVAGPRDFVINLLINGTIACWLFGGAADVPVAGAGSIFEMLLPMAAIESAVTSFTGLLNGRSKLRKTGMVPPTCPRRDWIVPALRSSLLQGLFGLFAAVIAMLVIRWTIPTVTLSPAAATTLIGLLSGALGYVVHARGVMKARRLFAS